jgi:SAM-dependent methyltransferase
VRPCPHCAHARATVRYDFGGQRIVRCAACELLYLDPWPDETETGAVYGEEYFQNADFLRGANEALFGYADYVAERFNKQLQYVKIVRGVRALLGQRPGRPRLLEVGCGFGYFLDVAFEEGFDVEGLEFNPHAVERLRRKYAFPILSGALERTDLEPGALDAVAMFDVIEHLRDPFGALDRIRKALAPRGVLVISTPDAESPVSRLIGKRLEDFRRTREHLFFFGRRTLAQILAEHGFEVIRIRSIGHTFELGFLLDRLALYNRPLFGSLRRIVTSLGLAQTSIYLNPLTKMIAFARVRS